MSGSELQKKITNKNTFIMYEQYILNFSLVDYYLEGTLRQLVPVCDNREL